MRISPLRQLVLAAMFWLPAMFFLWYTLRSVVVYPVIRLAGTLLAALFPDLFVGFGQEYHQALFGYVAELGDVPGLPGSALAVEEQRINVLVFCYGLPLFLGLVAATPLAWRHVFLQATVGIVVISAIAAVGVASEVLFMVLYGVEPAVTVALQSQGFAPQAAQAAAAASADITARFADHGLNADLVGLLRQFSYLVLPAVTPPVLWILLNRRFLEELVGWRTEPGAAGAGHSGVSPDAASGTDQEQQRG